MKKNILKVAFVAAFALVAGYGIYTAKAQSNLSELALDNVEALARGEINPACENGCVSGADGCYCNGYYPQFAEFTGWH